MRFAYEQLSRKVDKASVNKMTRNLDEQGCFIKNPNKVSKVASMKIKLTRNQSFEYNEVAKEFVFPACSDLSAKLRASLLCWKRPRVHRVLIRGVEHATWHRRQVRVEQLGRCLREAQRCRPESRTGPRRRRLHERRATLGTTQTGQREVGRTMVERAALLAAVHERSVVPWAKPHPRKLVLTRPVGLATVIALLLYARQA